MRRGKYCRDAAGHPTRMVGLVRDISQQKQAEIDLRYRDEVLHAVTIGAAQILAASSLGEGKPKALEAIGRAVKVDRVIVLESIGPQTKGKQSGNLVLLASPRRACLLSTRALLG